MHRNRLETRRVERLALRFGVLLMGAVALTACSKRGSMADRTVTPDTYTRAYDARFKGEETLGWGPELMTVWSRLGAAGACGIPYDRQAALAKLEAMKPIGTVAHELNGIEYHAMQAQQVKGFCTDARKADIRAFLKSW